ncbi:MAG: glutathione S-transferase [Nannocystaceae bacterium]
MLELFIANKNYSSWSLRPWLVLQEIDAPFVERMVRFDDAGAWAELRSISPAGKVPCLRDGDLVIWESLAIVERLAEARPQVWPRDPAARAWARSASAEMHAGFAALRSRCSMSCGIRVRLRERPPALERDLERLGGLLSEGLGRFGGPWLAGPHLTAVDAFFAPVAFRAQTYGLALGGPADAYLARLRERPAMRAWYASALAEPWRDPAHDLEIAEVGEIVADLRASPSAAS